MVRGRHAAGSAAALVSKLVGVDDESGRGELLDDLMSEPVSDGSVAANRQWVRRLRVFWHLSRRWPYWPATVVVVLAVLGVLIYSAVSLIAGFFSGIVD
jgi:hypothetical protein